MNACAACLHASVLRSESLTFAERRHSSTVEVARLLRLEPEEMLEELRRDHPDIDESLAVTTERLLDEWCEREGLWTVCRHEPEFPERLRRFDSLSDVPAVIYGVGRKELFDELTDDNGLAIVGARRASAYGREVAYSLANEAAGAGMIVVSGMALGVDGAAHRGALQGGGRTIAVLAGGPEQAYPRSHRLLHEQIRAAGCVISENPPGAQAQRWAFVARNRLIAGLGAMTVFVEGSAESGAMHTVRFAEELGSGIGAVPGPITGPLSVGPNKLLAVEGVTVVCGLSDVLEELAITPMAPRLPGFADDGLDELPAAILELIAAGDRTPRELAQSLPASVPREISRALGQLELRGMIERETSGEYVRRR
ncbi:MAG: DNA-protecting protein DprA [Thermoleophilaceae bacterium]|nr:DNA-protecting protein DprA [Thermoleophilaceae bacterium]